jgi:hypothetical protein
MNLFKLCNHECEITTKRVQRLWQTQRTSTLWCNIKNIKSKLAMSNYNEPNFSLRIIWVTLLIYSVFRVVMSVKNAVKKGCSVRLFLQLLVRGLVCGICVCVHIVVSSTYVFVLFFRLCTICCHFLWMVYFVLTPSLLLGLLHLGLYLKSM